MLTNTVIYVSTDTEDKITNYNELIESIDRKLNYGNSINPGLYDTMASNIKKLDKESANKELDRIVSEFNELYSKQPDCKEDYAILREKESPILTINIENMRYAFDKYKRMKLQAIQDTDLIEHAPFGKFPSMVLSLIGQSNDDLKLPFMCTDLYAMDYINALFTLTAERLCDFEYDKREHNREHKENTFSLLVLGLFSFKYSNAGYRH